MCPVISYPSLALSFLKLYTTMPVAKLAGFLDLPEQEFRIQLLVFKHKMKNLVWTSGISALEGEFQSASEVDFYIDKVTTIHVPGLLRARPHHTRMKTAYFPCRDTCLHQFSCGFK